eukprot:596161_1
MMEDIKRNDDDNAKNYFEGIHLSKFTQDAVHAIGITDANDKQSVYYELQKLIKIDDRLVGHIPYDEEHVQKTIRHDPAKKQTPQPSQSAFQEEKEESESNWKWSWGEQSQNTNTKTSINPFSSFGVSKAEAKTTQPAHAPMNALSVYKQRVTEIYNDAGQSHKLQKMLTKFEANSHNEARMHNLYVKICGKYNVTPEDMASGQGQAQVTQPNTGIPAPIPGVFSWQSSGNACKTGSSASAPGVFSWGSSSNACKTGPSASISDGFSWGSSGNACKSKTDPSASKFSWNFGNAGKTGPSTSPYNRGSFGNAYNTQFISDPAKHQQFENKNIELENQYQETEQKYNDLQQNMKLKSEYDKLRQEINGDVRFYRKWNHDNIATWIVSLGQEFKVYESCLREKLNEEAVEGEDLAHLSTTDLDRFGIKKFKHKRMIVERIKSLIQSEDKNEGINETAFVG